MGLVSSPSKISRPFLRGVVFALGLILFLRLAPAQETRPVELTPWKVIRQKTFPNYKVEILQRWTKGRWPRVDSMKARIIPHDGGAVTEYSATFMTPDPRDYVIQWKGGLLDLNGDRLEDLVLLSSTGGAHCCYSYTIYSLAKDLKKIGDLEMGDCGEKIRLADLNGNGKMEIISCDARFTYLGNLPYSESPFPPAVYTLGPNGYERADKMFQPVYQEDIKNQEQTLAQGYRPAAALQIATDYFLLGQEAKGWEAFEKYYQGQDKEKIKLQLLKRLGLKIAPAANPASSDAEESSGQ